jgi:transposase
MYERVAAIDVGKKIIAVAVRTPGERAGKRRQQVRKDNTCHQTLAKMVAWLSAEGVTHVSMEATGIYWKPIFHAVCEAERPVEVLLVTRGMSRTFRAAKATPWTRCGWRS